MITKQNILMAALDFVDKRITFMFSQSGIPNNYNLYLAKHLGYTNKSLRFSLNDKGALYQCADGEVPYMLFKTMEELKKYVFAILEIKEEVKQ